MGHRFRRGVRAVAACGLASWGAAHAEFSLEQQLSDSLAGTTSAGERIHQSAAGHWELQRDESHPGMNCAVTFVSTASKGTSFSFFGPKPTVPFGVLAYASPGIPNVAKTTETRVEMLFDGEAPAAVRAFHLPRQGDRGFVLVPTQDIRTSIDPINDREKNMGLKLNGASVFRMDYDGGKTARAALLACLDGKAYKK